MMLPTHALVGLAIAVPVAFVAPESADVALLAGVAGGVLPDLDLYAGHRRTLHFPVYYSALATAAFPLAVFHPTATTIGVAVGLVAAALHCVMDVFGGGLELRPWEGTSDRAVYDHLRGRWLPPRRWVRYDGAPEDLLLAVVLAGPILPVVEGPFRGLVLVTLAVGGVYAALRRTLPGLALRLVDDVIARAVPDRVLGRLPRRYLRE